MIFCFLSTKHSFYMSRIDCMGLLSRYLVVPVLLLILWIAPEDLITTSPLYTLPSVSRLLALGSLLV